MTTLVNLLSTEQRKKILEEILYVKQNSFSVRKVAKSLKLNPSTVSRFFSDLIDLNIMSENFSVNYTFPLTIAVKKILNVDTLIKYDITGITKKIFKSNLLGVGVYGSWANGTNMRESDLDIWIKLKDYPGLKKSAEIQSKLSTVFDSEVNIDFLHKKRLENIRKKDKLYYHAISFNSILLLGDKLES